MAEPIVFVSTHDIREGKLEEFRESYREGTTAIREEKSGTVAFLAYLDEDETAVSTIHVFPDAEAMDRHMEGVGERAARAAEVLEFREFEIYGRPSDEVMTVMEQSASSGATLSVRPEFVSGFLRLDR